MTTRRKKPLFAYTPHMLCPACGAPVKGRTSEEVTHLSREIRYQCLDTDCGEAFVALLSYVRTTSPSALGKIDPRGRLRRPPPRPLNAPDPLSHRLSETRPPDG